MSTTPQAKATPPSRGREHPSNPHVAWVALGSPFVCCISPSDDRSALLVDVYDADGALTLIASAPGVLAEDVRVVTAGSAVTIRVTQRSVVRPTEYSTVRRERYAGYWMRVIELPFTIDWGGNFVDARSRRAGDAHRQTIIPASTGRVTICAQQ